MVSKEENRPNRQNHPAKAAMFSRQTPANRGAGPVLFYFLMNLPEANKKCVKAKKRLRKKAKEKMADLLLL